MLIDAAKRVDVFWRSPFDTVGQSRVAVDDSDPVKNKLKFTY